MTIAKQRNKQSFLRLETRPDDAGFKFVSLKVLQFKVKERCKFLIGSILKNTNSEPSRGLKKFPYNFLSVLDYFCV